MSNNIPDRQKIIEEVKKADLISNSKEKVISNDKSDEDKLKPLEPLNQAPIEIVEFQLADHDDVKKIELSDARKSIMIPEYFDQLAEKPILAIIDFLRDRKFDYDLTEWFHIAYTNEGVCEMTVEQNQITLGLSCTKI